jgi:hypothetical protein
MVSSHPGFGFVPRALGRWVKPLKRQFIGNFLVTFIDYIVREFSFEAPILRLVRGLAQRQLLIDE